MLRLISLRRRPVGQRQLDVVPVGRLEAEPGVVTRVPFEHDERVPAGGGAGCDLPHQSSADPEALVCRVDRQRREHHGRRLDAVGIEQGASADHDVAGHLVVDDGNEREFREVLRRGSDRVDQACFCSRTAGTGDHVGDRPMVARRLGSDLDHRFGVHARAPYPYRLCTR